MLLLGVVQAQVTGAPTGAGSYDLLQTEILTGSQASVTFSDLGDYAADYQHLQIRAAARDSRSDIFGVTLITLNGDTGANYSAHTLRGNGSTVTSGGAGSASNINIETSGNTAGGFGGFVLDLLDPFETTKNKTLRVIYGRAEGGDPAVALVSGARYNTEAISSITFTPNASASYVANSRFSLYGLRK